MQAIYAWSLLVLAITVMASVNSFLYFDLRRRLAEISRRWSSAMVAKEVKDNERLTILEGNMDRLDEGQCQLEARLLLLMQQQQQFRITIGDRALIEPIEKPRAP
jgi:hypothetical protein